MTSDSDSEKPSEQSAQKRGRPQKPPLTIDLTANPARSTEGAEPPPAASADEASAGPAAATAAPTTGEGEPPAAAEETASAKPSEEASPPEASPAAPAEEHGSVEPPASPPPPKARAPAPVMVGYALAGLIGAAIMIAIVFAIEASGILPSPGKVVADAAAARASTAAAGVAALEARVAAIGSRTAGMTNGAEDLAKRIDALEAASTATGDRIGKVETTLAVRPEARTANMDQVLDDLMARIERVEAAVGKGGNLTPPAGLAELTSRIAALENSTAAISQRLATLQARPSTATESEKAARALAIGSLRQAAGEGAPFAGNLAMLQALGLDETDIAALRPLAEKGAPPESELAGEFPEVADRILAASAAVDPNAGFFDRLAGFARGLVTVRPTTPIPGDTPDAIVSRMQAAVDHSDLARALAERNALPDNGKAVSAAWAQGAADRLAIDRLVEKLSRAAGTAAGAAD